MHNIYVMHVVLSLYNLFFNIECSSSYLVFCQIILLCINDTQYFIPPMKTYNDNHHTYT